MAGRLTRYVPSTVVIGRRGRVITRGFREIGGVRRYRSTLVIGRRGLPEILKGWAELAGRAALKERT